MNMCDFNHQNWENILASGFFMIGIVTNDLDFDGIYWSMNPLKASSSTSLVITVDV